MFKKYEARFSDNYKEKGDDGVTDRNVSRSIGLSLEGLYQLISLLHEDLDKEKFGIGWWAQYAEFGTKRRIFVSDYLYMAVKSIEMNCIDAKLHFLEAEDAWEYENQVLLRHIQKHENRLVGFPKRESLKDDLGRLLIETNIAGFVRAVGSILDCVGASVVGILGLELRIDKVTFKVVLNHLKHSSSEVNVEFYKQLETVIARSGPEGWIDWIIDLRNMYVHKPRRLRLSKVELEPMGVFDSKGVPLVKDARLIGLLPKRPSESDVETWAGSRFDGLLTENARTTLSGVMESIQAFLGDISVCLVEVWKRRKLNPLLIKQPSAQWVLKTTKDDKVFQGYAQGEELLDIKAMIGNSELWNRFVSSATDDGNRKKWNNFD